MRHIASVSWGKDSLAMLLMLIERGETLDEVVFYDTGMEFKAIYEERNRWLPMLAGAGIEYTELHPKEPFLESMFLRPVKKRGTDTIHKHGYGWCGGVCRWGTTAKTSVLDRHAKSQDAVVYVGIAADEPHRFEKPDWKRHPLVEWDITELDCLHYCRKYGATWTDGDVPLYSILDRVSCWCCRNKNLKELRGIHDNLPSYWERLKGMEKRIGEPMKQSGSLTELERRWMHERNQGSRLPYKH